MVDREETFQRRKEDLALLFADLVVHGGPVLVEGPRDRDVLLAAGVPAGRVVMLHGKTDLEVVDRLEQFHGEVVLLLDYDKEGEKLHDRFTRELQRLGVRVSARYKNKIRAIFDGHVDCIEGLRRYVES